MEEFFKNTLNTNISFIDFNSNMTYVLDVEILAKLVLLQNWYRHNSSKCVPVTSYQIVYPTLSTVLNTSLCSDLVNSG